MFFLNLFTKKNIDINSKLVYLALVRRDILKSLFDHHLHCRFQGFKVLYNIDPNEPSVFDIDSYCL